MSNQIYFVVPGDPRGKGRPRAKTAKSKTGKSFVHMYTDEKTVSYETIVALSANKAMAGKEIIKGAVCVNLDMFLPIPKSWSKKKQKQAADGLIYPTVKPDIDNVEKAIFDAINNIVWCDDVQVVFVKKMKKYSSVPCVKVTVQCME